MASIMISSNITSSDPGPVYAVCFQESEFTDVANVDSVGRASVIRYVMDHKDVGGGPVVNMGTTAGIAGVVETFTATLTTELANVDSPPESAAAFDTAVTNHHAYVVAQSGKFENAFQVKHVPITTAQV